MIGEWVREKHVSGDLDFLIPEEYYILRYTEDVPFNDEKQFDCISNYMMNQYNIKENEALIHWAYYKQNEQSKMGVIGESFSLRGELNGNFAILRMEESYLDENKSYIHSTKFLYLFFTALSVPMELPIIAYNEIKNSFIDLINKYELKLNIDRMGIFAPILYLINDEVDCEFFKQFESKINGISKQILFHNPIKDLHKSKMINVYNKY
jgi:hypothetical protein